MLEGRPFPRLMITCPHGDYTCPCPDGDVCHYEGTDPMTCPNPPGELPHHHPPVMLKDGKKMDIGPTWSHCHVEGCTWDVDTCGLARIGLKAHIPYADDQRVPPSDPIWRCGANRASEWLWFDHPEPWWKDPVSD